MEEVVAILLTHAHVQDHGVVTSVSCQLVMDIHKAKQEHVMEEDHVMDLKFVDVQIPHPGEVHIVNIQNVMEFYPTRF